MMIIKEGSYISVTGNASVEDSAAISERGLQLQSWNNPLKIIGQGIEKLCIVEKGSTELKEEV